MSITPNHFEPPASASFSSFSLEVLSPEFAEQDFAAVTASAESIRHVFGPENSWPSAQITFDENLADLVRHEREFNERTAFAYCILDPKLKRYLGCLYIMPLLANARRDQRHERFCAEVYLWLSVLHHDITDALVQAEINAWLAVDWRLPQVAWPGRNPNWTEWKALSLLPANAV